MPYDQRDPRRPRPLTTSEHIALLQEQVAGGAPGDAARLGVPSPQHQLSRPGGDGAAVGLPPASLALGDGPAGTSSAGRPAPPDYSALRIDAAANPHGAERPEADPRRSRLLALMQLVPAAAGAAGLALGSEGVGHVGAGFAHGMAGVREEDRARLATEQAAWGDWLQTAQRTNRDLQIKGVEAQFGLDREAWRDQVAGERQDRQLAERNRLEASQAEERRQQAHAKRTRELLDAGAFDEAMPRLLEEGFTEEEATAKVAGLRQAHEIDERRKRRLAAGGGSGTSRDTSLGRIERYHDIEDEMEDLDEELAELEARRADAPRREWEALDRDIRARRREVRSARNRRRSAVASLSNDELAAARAERTERQAPPPGDEAKLNNYVHVLGQRLQAGTDPREIADSIDAAMAEGDLTKEERDQLLRTLAERRQ